MSFGERKKRGNSALVGLVVAILSITMALNSKISSSVKSWDDTALKDLAHSYRHRVFLLRDEKSAAATTTADADVNATTGKPLDGIVILVTGSTSGIGRSLVLWAFRQGATILAMGRSGTKLEVLRKELGDIQEEQNHEQRLESRFFPIVAEMSDLNSVSTAVDVIRSDLSRAGLRTIDIVVCNAGLWLASTDSITPRSTEQGYETTFGVNYLSHVLLTEKLMRTRMADGGSDEDGSNSSHNEYLLSPLTSRVVQVSSSFHLGVDGTYLAVSAKQESNVHKTAADEQPNIYSSPIASHAPNLGRTGFIGFILNSIEFVFQGQRQYANSKLAQILHARESNREFLINLGHEDRAKIQSYSRVYVPFVSACPGWVGTHILRSTVQRESWMEKMFHALTHDVDGYGLSSILKSMFLPLLDFDVEENMKSKDGAVQLKNDFFPNHGGFLFWTAHVADSILATTDTLFAAFFGETFMRHVLTYSRDVVASVGCCVVLVLQRFFKVSASINENPADKWNSFPYKSYSVTYDRELQHGLHQWSLDAINDFL